MVYTVHKYKTCELRWLISPTKMVFDYRGGPRITRKNTRIHNLVRKEAPQGRSSGKGHSYVGEGGFQGYSNGGKMYSMLVVFNVSFREYIRNADFSMKQKTRKVFISTVILQVRTVQLRQNTAICKESCAMGCKKTNSACKYKIWSSH